MGHMSKLSVPKLGFSGMNGFRQRMEDGIFIHDPSSEERLVAIFDGHGGREAAHLAAYSLSPLFAEAVQNLAPLPAEEHQRLRDFIASETAYETPRMQCDGTDPSLLASDPTIRALEYTFERLDARVSQLPGGSTAIVLFFQQRVLYVANLGDSRAVLCREGQAVPLSFDHTPRSRREQQRLRGIPGAFTHQGRTQGMLAVTRALGDINLRPAVSAYPDYSRIRLTNQDSFVIVACDGFWDVFSNSRAVQFATQLLKQTNNNPLQTSILLRDAAFAAGSTDNISVCIIQL